MESPLGPQSRVVIVGTSGAGKSTLARALAKRLGVADIELDALHWEPRWTQAAPEVFRARIEAAMAAAPGWVVHGNYSKVNDLTVGRASVLIWLDYSRPVVFWRVLKRSVLRILTREELWAGNRETFRKTFLSRDSILKWSWDTYPLRKKRYAEFVRSPEAAHLAVHRFTHPRQAEEFLARTPSYASN